MGWRFCSYAVEKYINKIIRLSLDIINIYSKCEWVVPLKDEKGIAITNTFQKIVNQTKYGSIKAVNLTIDQ